jgi:hypothetical protein
MKIAGLKQVFSSFSLAGIAALGLAWAPILAPTPAAAQNRGTPEQQQACQPDAMRLCSEFIPDVDRITACMVKKRLALSPPCRAVFTGPSHKGKSFKHS